MAEQTINPDSVALGNRSTHSTATGAKAGSGTLATFDWAAGGDDFYLLDSDADVGLTTYTCSQQHLPFDLAGIWNGTPFVKAELYLACDALSGNSTVKYWAGTWDGIGFPTNGDWDDVSGTELGSFTVVADDTLTAHTLSTSMLQAINAAASAGSVMDVLLTNALLFSSTIYYYVDLRATGAGAKAPKLVLTRDDGHAIVLGCNF